jgi:HEAT repeat protein
MDEVERLIGAFKARSAWSVAPQLDALLDLEQLDDPRIEPFLVHVLADRREPTEVRIHVLKRLRNRRLQPAHRPTVAEAMLQVTLDRSSPPLRLQAVLALAEFTDINGVPGTLGGLALDTGDTIDVRYSAFTSLQRAGPTTECATLLRQLSADELLGRSARSVLSSWHLE